MSGSDYATLAQTVRRSDHVLSQDLGEDAVLLDLQGEQYFGLNKVGTRIWQLLEGPTRLEDICRTLCDEFDADSAQIEHDMLNLIGEMQRAGLVALA